MNDPRASGDVGSKSTGDLMRAYSSLRPPYVADLLAADWRTCADGGQRIAWAVMARPEYTNAPRVFVTVDNGSDHRGQAAISRLARAHPNAIMIHTPVHASWLNQIPVNRPSARRHARAV